MRTLPSILAAFAVIALTQSSAHGSAVVARWNLGEQDPGVVGGKVANSNTVAAVAGAGLSLQAGAPAYSSDVAAGGSTLSILFRGPSAGDWYSSTTVPAITSMDQNNFALDFDAKPTASPNGYSTAVCIGQYGGSAAVFCVDAAGNWNYHVNGVGNVITGPGPGFNQWQHVQFKRVGGVNALRVNGAQIGAADTTISGAADPYFSIGAPRNAGGTSDTGGCFVGNIDNVVLTDLSLSVGAAPTTVVSTGAVHAGITLKSLLQELTDRDRLASWPKVEYSCRAFTSYDRASVAPDKPGWFANGDYGEFARVETNGGRNECVMLDAEGPGAVVFLHNAAVHSGSIRVYFDNNPQPEIVARVDDLIGGKFLTGKPFSYNLPEIPLYGEEEWIARNLWFPLPYARHCKITWDGVPTGIPPKQAMFYYNGLYLTFAPGTEVETFAMGQMTAYAAEIKTAGAKLMVHQPPKTTGTQTTKAALRIEPGSSEVLLSKTNAPGALRRLLLNIKADDYQQALRSTILEIRFDGEHCVWCPAGDFFGTGYDIYPHTTWYTRVDQEGAMECLWPMPFARSVEVRLRNLGQEKITAFAEVDCDKWRWDDRSMHFHATWRQATKYGGPPVDYNYVTIQGRGVYVGDSLDVFACHWAGAAWWGEGDEKIWVDDESFPSHFGTGTEDYYGYSWCRPNFFEKPWHAVPFGHGNKFIGCSVNNRYRLLDAIPFKKSLKFDMEISLPFAAGGGTGQSVNFTPTTFFYALPGAVVSVKPDPETASRRVVLSRRQFKDQESSGIPKQSGE